MIIQTVAYSGTLRHYAKKVPGGYQAACNNKITTKRNPYQNSSAYAVELAKGDDVTCKKCQDFKTKHQAANE